MYSLCGDQGLFSQQCVHKFYPECISWAESQGFNIAGSKPAAHWEGLILTPHKPLRSAGAPQIDLQSPLLHPFQLPLAHTYWYVSEEAYTTPHYFSPKGHQWFCHTHHNFAFLLKLPAASFAKAQLHHAKSQLLFDFSSLSLSQQLILFLTCRRKNFGSCLPGLNLNQQSALYPV